MAIKQTRRSISVRGTTYDSLRRYCAEKSMSMSEVVEEQLARILEGSEPVVAPVANVASVANVTPVVVAPTGRPAPVPYEKVVAPRANRAPEGDYRTIRF